MDEKFLDIAIQDDESLLTACDYLHDSVLDLSKVQYNEAEGTWQAPFEREFLEDPSKIERKRKCLIFSKVSFPVVHSVLTLEGVKTCRVEDKSKIQRYMFNECRVKDGMYRFVFCENMTIYITFSEKPAGNLKDQHFLEEKKSISII
jgi:hypothetical protein